MILVIRNIDKNLIRNILRVIQREYFLFEANKKLNIYIKMNIHRYIILFVNAIIVSKVWPSLHNFLFYKYFFVFFLEHEYLFVRTIIIIKLETKEKINSKTKGFSGIRMVL